MLDIPRKLAPDKENSEYFKRLGNTALSQCGGCLSGGGEAPKNVFKLKNRQDSLNFFHNSTDLWGSLLSNYPAINQILFFMDTQFTD
jgi:uncharacterized protein YneR